MKPSELIIFDFDGVIVDSEAISAKVIVQELAKFDIIVSKQEVFDKFVGRSLTDVAVILQMSTSSDVFSTFNAAYHTSLQTAFSNELKAMPGFKDVIRNLNVPFCIASSSSKRRVLRSLEVTGLRGIFGKNIFTASQVDNGKPAPDLFLFAAEEMGFAPDACLVIEDSSPGVQAAQAAQMRVWRFTGGSHFAKLTAHQDAITLSAPTFDRWASFFDLNPCLKVDVC